MLLFHLWLIGDDCMKILIVDVNWDYKNIMYRQFYNYLSYGNEISFFGPGYVSRDSLEKGILNFMDKKEYDAVILGVYFVYSTNISGMHYSAYSVHRKVIPYYNVNDAYQCCHKIYKQLLDLKNIIKIFFYYEDPLAMGKGDQKICAELMEKDFFLMSWPSEMLVTMRQRINGHNAGYNAMILNTNSLLEFMEKNKKQSIPLLLTAISFHEIFFGEYSIRTYDWCVPGNRVREFYPGRDTLANILKNKGYKCWDYDPYQKLSVVSIEKKQLDRYVFRNREEKIFSYFYGKNNYVSSYPNMESIAACREIYLESMRKTKRVLVDGGITKLLVRKYFEACACGALMVGMETSGLEAMGFVDKYNCRVINDGDIEEQIEEIMKDDHNNEEIAKKGQQLILKKHMFTNRVLSLTKTIETIKNGNYSGAYWNKGEYVIKEEK